MYKLPTYQNGTKNWQKPIHHSLVVTCNTPMLYNVYYITHIRGFWENFKSLITRYILYNIHIQFLVFSQYSPYIVLSHNLSYSIIIILVYYYVVAKCIIIYVLGITSFVVRTFS